MQALVIGGRETVLRADRIDVPARGRIGFRANAPTPASPAGSRLSRRVSRLVDGCTRGLDPLDNVPDLKMSGI